MTGREFVAPMHSRLVICEGKTDREFFRQMFKTRGIQNIEAFCPDAGGGWTQFGRFLRDLELSEAFLRGVVKLVIVAGDNDEAKSFRNICKQVSTAGYNVPTDPKRIVRTQDKPALSILMIPEVSPGCLETLCIMAGYGKWPALQQPLETYIDVTPARGWRKTQQDKARVECLLASTSEPRPAVALHDHWQQDQEYHIPVESPVFNDVAEYLLSDEIAGFA